jgi:hypothetical protein
LKRALGICLSAALIATMLFFFSPPAFSSCPRGTVGKMKTGAGASQLFAWRENTPTTFGTGEKLEIDLALIPFPETASGGSSLAVWTESSGVLLYIDFGPGGSTSFGISYEPHKWNNLKVIADFDSQTYTVKMNGQTSAPIDLASTSNQISYIRLDDQDNVSADPVVGYVDTFSATKRLASGGTVALLPPQNFKDAPPPETENGTLKIVPDPVPEAATGAACPSSIRLNIGKTQTSIKASGKVNPAHPGDQVDVTLFRKKDGSFVKVVHRRRDLTAESKYSATFARPPKGRCKIVATFGADEDHLGSHTSKSFDC